MDGIRLCQLPRFIQHSQQFQQAFPPDLIGRIHSDLGSYGGGQQLTAVNGGVSCGGIRLLHDLSGRTHQPHCPVLRPGQRIAALLHLDQQGVRQLPLNTGVFDLDIGQGLGDVPDHLILVQQKEVVTVLHAAGLTDLRLRIALLPSDDHRIHPEKQGDGRHQTAADQEYGQQLIEEAAASPSAPPRRSSPSCHDGSPLQSVSQGEAVSSTRRISAPSAARSSSML